MKLKVPTSQPKLKKRSVHSDTSNSTEKKRFKKIVLDVENKMRVRTWNEGYDVRVRFLVSKNSSLSTVLPLQKGVKIGFEHRIRIRDPQIVYEHIYYFPPKMTATSKT